LEYFDAKCFFYHVTGVKIGVNYFAFYQFKLWRVIESENIKSLSGAIEYGAYDIDSVEVRVKTLYITDDLIQRAEVAVNDPLYNMAYNFTMYFNIDDEEGNNVPIDRIHSLEVEYTIKRTSLWLLSDNEYVIKDIQATETRNAVYWPYIFPQSVINNITPANRYDLDGNLLYEWKVNLGTYSTTRTLGANVTLDQTSILTIDYYYDGIFYEDQVVVDEPYDEDDIITTTMPLFDQIKAYFESLIEQPLKILIGIGILILTLVVFKLLSMVGSLAKEMKTVLFFVFKAIYYIIKWFILGVYHIILFLVYQLPNGSIKALYWLFTPKEKRLARERVDQYVSRRI